MHRAFSRRCAGAAQRVAVLALTTIACALAQTPPAIAPAAPKEPDAAAIYREAVAAARRAFEVSRDEQQFLDLPPTVEDEPAKWRFPKDEWGGPVAKAGAALAMFAAAARLPACDFGPGTDPTDCGYDAVHVTLHDLTRLCAAHGWHALADGKPETAVQDAITGLRHAVHLGHQPSASGCVMALWCEQAAMALLREVLATAPAAVPRELLRCELDEHAKRRADRPRLLANMRTETVRMLSTVTAATQVPAEPERESAADRLVRERGAAIRDRIVALADEWLTPLAQVDDAGLDAALASLKRTTTSLREAHLPKDIERRLPRLEPAAAVEAAATMFALMAVPNVDDPLRRERDVRGELHRLRAQLAEPPAAGDKR